MASARVREAYAKATGKASSSQSKLPDGKKRIPTEEDDCPVCYENMFKAKENTLKFCDECGNGLHKECFQQCESLLNAGRLPVMSLTWLLDRG